jgi:hypothetical protein
VRSDIGGHATGRSGAAAGARDRLRRREDAADHSRDHGRTRASSGIAVRPTATLGRGRAHPGPGGRSATRGSGTYCVSRCILVDGIVMVVMVIVAAVMDDTMKDQAVRVVLRNYVISRGADYVEQR